MEDYRFSVGKDMRIIFFMDAIEHICRLARILRSERGNGLLIGVGGMGKQSLTRLASHLNGYKFVSALIIQLYKLLLSKQYDQRAYHNCRMF